MSGPGDVTDVVIVGGGLVGASLAIALDRLGIETTMIEAAPMRRQPAPTYDDRALALNAASCEILAALGLWPAIAADCTPIRSVSVSVLDRPGRVELHPEEVGRDRFGHVVEARVFGGVVLDALQQAPSISVRSPARVTAVAPGEASVRLTLDEDGTAAELNARLLVAADGAGSFVRQALGIAVTEHDYGQTAVIANVTPQRAHRGRAYERFTGSGPCALLPHRDGRCGLVWSVAAEDADDLLAMDETSFLERATERTGAVLGSLARLGQRTAYPLRQVIAERDTAPRTLIVGNAAHAIHPVGAQGFNLGLRDVAVLAEVLAGARRADPAADPGGPTLLEQYSAWRRDDQASTAAYTDRMARGWGHPSSLVGLARGVTFWAHALVPPLRRQLMIRAMGFRGRVPALAMHEPLPGWRAA